MLPVRLNDLQRPRSDTYALCHQELSRAKTAQRCNLLQVLLRRRNSHKAMVRETMQYCLCKDKRNAPHKVRAHRRPQSGASSRLDLTAVFSCDARLIVHAK